jgi:gas vesicle protein
MTHHEDETPKSKSSGAGFLSGFMFGGLIGATLGLVLAPRSGEATRQLIKDRSLDLRDQVTLGVDEVKASVDELQQRGREFVVEKKERIEKTAQAVRDTARETWASSGDGHADELAASSYRSSTAN